MKPFLTILAVLLLAGPALAGDVYVMTDKQGNRIYTDRPDTLPAQKAGVQSQSTDPAEADARYAEEMDRYSSEQQAADESRAKAAEAKRAEELTAADRAQRCVAARSRYQATLNSIRIYEELPNGQRRYLSSEEIDAARANAKQAMDEFCTSP
jgi:Na+-transporting NADH:ubiquinone oxidoreductase subunit NqrC